MKREEAIKTLTSLKEQYEIAVRATEHVGIKAGLKDAYDAINTAIAALRGHTREQVEQMRGTWIPVMESEITGFDPEFAGRDPIGGYKCSRCKAEAVVDCNDEYVLSDFCHECGAPMTDEAVDITLQRLEEMKSVDYGDHTTVYIDDTIQEDGSGHRDGES